ncbi:unnamed protein product [Schistosoma curassoni]|uniref:Uncharacterized protein n=1 Tax=Schistosoma curassoni TaxID=6186 RepID=A0A183JQT4_9TREM|nr:unnamed protein product [Schistosoma curassoni]
MTTDEELDMECALSGVSQFFYKNLTTCTLGQYGQIPNDTDMLRTVNTPESLRACYVRTAIDHSLIDICASCVHCLDIALINSLYKQRWIVASSGIQFDVHFVLFGTRQLYVPASQN